MEEIMRGGYIIARENFKDAERHVSAETDPVMFNLLFGLQSLTDQIESDFVALQEALTNLRAPAPRKALTKRPQAKKVQARKAPPKKARAAKTRRSR
jgi:hypothetical protein